MGIFEDSQMSVAYLSSLWFLPLDGFASRQRRCSQRVLHFPLRTCSCPSEYGFTAFNIYCPTSYGVRPYAIFYFPLSFVSWSRSLCFFKTALRVPQLIYNHTNVIKMKVYFLLACMFVCYSFTPQVLNLFGCLQWRQITLWIANPDYFYVGKIFSGFGENSIFTWVTVAKS